LPGAFVLGYLMQKFVFRRVTGADPSYQIVTTFGLSIVIQNALLKHYTADTRSLSNKIGTTLQTKGWKINDQITLGWLPLITFFCGVGSLVLLAVFLRYTQLGRAFRATSDDPDAAQLMGIDNRRVYGLALGIAFMTVALAGVLLGARSQFDPFNGPSRLIYAFESVIIGGLGSLWGTLAGGITLGVAQAFGRQISPQWGELFGHLVFLAVLATKPTGMFGKKLAR
jgi:branched-chain amino acid transport system permease protein